MGRRPLRIAVIGGGIGGLTAALSLRQAGFDADIYEQAPALTHIGGGINMGPNAARVLIRLGLGEGLLREGVRPASTHQRRWDDGRTCSARRSTRNAKSFTVRRISQSTAPICSRSFHRVCRPSASISVIASSGSATRATMSRRGSTMARASPPIFWSAPMAFIRRCARCCSATKRRNSPAASPIAGSFRSSA
jgi:hypothetical protein